MLWPDSLILNGQPVPLAELLADVTIHHGRAGLSDEPTASTCQVTILDVDKAFVEAFEVGVPLELTVRDDVAGTSSPRFTGRVTDALLDGDVLTVIATGRLSTLGQYKIGLPAEGVWPVEPWSDRVIRIFTNAGLVAPGALTNRITNGGFETTDFSSWAMGGTTLATLERDSSDFVSGSYSGRFTFPLGDSAAFVFSLPVGTVTLDVWLKAEAGRQVLIQVNESGGAVGDQATVYWRQPATGDWQRVTLTGPVQQPDRTGLYLILMTPDLPDGVLNLDDIVLRIGDSLLVLETDPTFDPPLAARDPSTAGATTLGDYLTFLAPMLGAAVADLPDGRILVQAIGARTIDARVELDPADVGYVPGWTQALPAGNIVTVRYTGDQSQSVTEADAASQAFYGDRPRTIDTAFTQTADATRRAQTALARGAFSHWNIPEAPVLRGLDVRVGEPIMLSGMPPSSPLEPWTPILEGWTDELNGADWTMLLALSDPLESGLVLPWDAIPADDPAFVWQALDPQTDWTEALTLEALSAG